MTRDRETLSDFTGKTPWNELCDVHPRLDHLDQKLPRIISAAGRLVEQAVEIGQNIREKLLVRSSEQ